MGLSGGCAHAARESCVCDPRGRQMEAAEGGAKRPLSELDERNCVTTGKMDSGEINARKKHRAAAQQESTTNDERGALVARVLVACDRDGDGVLDETEFDRLHKELCERLPPDATGGSLVSTFSAADTSLCGAIGKGELYAALGSVPDAVLRWWLELAEEGQIELVPSTSASTSCQPVRVPAAVVRMMRTVQMHLEETGLGVRFPAPFCAEVLQEMVTLLARLGTNEEESAAHEATRAMVEGGAGASDVAAPEAMALVTLEAAAALDFMQVDTCKRLEAEIASAARQLLYQEPSLLDAKSRDLLVQVLGTTAFAGGALAIFPNDGLKLRALLLDDAVCKMYSGAKDGTSLDLAKWQNLSAADVLHIAETLSSEHCKLTSLNLGGNSLKTLAGSELTSFPSWVHL